ncbi:MAG TPA: thioesterase family protein [Sphingomonas sp.]|uniref:acyl-CoA thioesterase n=1 Tax=Sphingomonas sp. TaxID=28214 RepID=UPI002ED92DC0
MTDPRPAPEPRGAYRRSVSIDTRWGDNDVYGHVNNVVYYAWIDSAVNRLLIEGGVLDIRGGDRIGLVVDSACRFLAPVAFPDRIDAGIRVGHIGRSSVRYEIGLFREGAAVPVAEARFVHVYVDRVTRRPVVIDPPLAAFLRSLQVGT